jgi:hypothetical protein
MQNLDTEVHEMKHMILACFLLVGLGAAQQTQIPTLQVCNRTTVQGLGIVRIESRIGAGPVNGTVEVNAQLACDSERVYPVGRVQLKVRMTDGLIGTISVDSTQPPMAFEQLSSAGQKTPVAY